MRLCRAVLHFKAVLDSDGSARAAGLVPLSTALELYFSTHFPAAVCFSRILGFYASVVAYQGIPVCRAVARFLHLLPGEDLSAEALRLWISLSVELAAREGSGGARCADLAVLHPEEFGGAPGVRRGAVGARRRSWLGGGGGPGPVLAAPGVAGAVVRDRLRAQGASAPLVPSDAFAEVVSEQLAGGRLPPADVGSLLFSLLGGGGGEPADAASHEKAGPLRVVWREDAHGVGELLPSQSPSRAGRAADATATSSGTVDFVAVEEGLLAVVDAWSAAEGRAHAALRAVLSLGGAAELAPRYDDDPSGTAESTDLGAAAASHDANVDETSRAPPAPAPLQAPPASPLQDRLPCAAGSFLATLQGATGLVALRSVGARDACNASSALVLHDARDPSALSPLLQRLVAGCSDALGGGLTQVLEPVALLLQRVWRLGLLFVSYDTRRSGLLPPWTFSVIVAASGLYDDDSATGGAAAVHKGLSRVLQQFAADPGPLSASAVFTGAIDRSSSGRVDVARYLHGPPAPTAAAAAAPTLASTAPTPPPVAIGARTVPIVTAETRIRGGGQTLSLSSTSQKVNVRDDEEGSSLPWATQLLRALPASPNGRPLRPREGAHRIRLITEDNVAVDYARFWAVLYGLVVEVRRGLGGGGGVCVCGGGGGWGAFLHCCENGYPLAWRLHAGSCRRASRANTHPTKLCRRRAAESKFRSRSGICC